jgi:hypothetical protein
LADNLNLPPFDVQTLRQEWKLLKQEVARMPAWQLPSSEQLADFWSQLKTEAARQECSIFELSSLMAISAVGRLPYRARRLSQCATVAARKTGKLLAFVLLENYASTLERIHQTGYLGYWATEFSPYLTAAAKHFSPAQSSYTEYFLSWCLNKHASFRAKSRDAHTG